jgi:ubiquinone/menaquinone biosynthesis C-methylase UbiE
MALQAAGLQGDCVSNTDWEAAYRRFESSAQEVRKFRGRLQWFGASEWPRDYQIVDLFCGRGNGLVALEQLGFSQLEGVDLSPTLLAQYGGSATLYEADCRQLPFDRESHDVVTIHGGLHHLARIPVDLEAVMAEAHRILRPGGLLVVVEPWSTPFLSVVHRACNSRLLCRVWPKLDALATMIDHERATYEAWLSRPSEVYRAIGNRFERLRSRRCWGKLWFLGRKRS